jgi:hypothetical protein
MQVITSRWMAFQVGFEPRFPLLITGIPSFRGITQTLLIL